MKNAILRLRGKQGRGDVTSWGGNEIGSMSQFHWDISVGDSWAFTVHDITILGARRNHASTGKYYITGTSGQMP